MSTTEATVIALPGAAGAAKAKRKRKTKRSQGSVYTRNGRWYAQVRVTDPATGVKRRVTEPIEGATDRATAQLGLDALLRSIADGSYFKRATRTRTFNQAADDLQAFADSERKSPETFRLRLSHLRAHFGERLVAALTTRDFEKYRQARVAALVAKRLGKASDASDDDRERATGSARATVNREVAAARTLFNRLVKAGELDAGANPLATGRLPQYSESENARTRYLSPEEMTQIEAACTEPFRSLVVIAINMGLRRGELLRVRQADVDLVSGILHVRRAKGGKPRQVRINAPAREAVEKLMQRPGPYVFGGAKPASKAWAASAWKRARKRAGLEDVHLHDLRHSCATWAIAAGASLPAVKETLGHSSIKVTERYMHADPGHLRGVGDALEKVWADRPRPAMHAQGARGRQAGRQQQGTAAADDTASAEVPDPVREENAPGRSRTCGLRIRSPRARRNASTREITPGASGPIATRRYLPRLPSRSALPCPVVAWCLAHFQHSEHARPRRRSPATSRPAPAADHSTRRCVARESTIVGIPTTRVVQSANRPGVDPFVGNHARRGGWAVPETSSCHPIE